MASSSGNSTSSQIRNSGSETNIAELNERKRKRMQSNRESARRSRMRKQKHLDDLSLQVDQLRRKNQQILQTIESTNHQYVNVEADNSILRAQMGELSQRLDSLNEIINYMNTLGGVGNSSVGINSFCEVDQGWLVSGMNNNNVVNDFGLFNGFTLDPLWTMHGSFDQSSYIGDVLQC